MWMERQLNEKDCGLYIIQAFINQFYKVKCDINYLKSIAIYEKSGISLFDLKKLATNCQLEMEILEGDFESFLNLKLNAPIVTLIKEENATNLHYVIIEEKTSDKILINDPARNCYWVSLDQFRNKFCSVIITVLPSADSKKITFPKSSDKLKIKQNLFWYLVIVSFALVVNIMGLASNFYSKFIFDAIFSLQEKNRLIILLIVFSWFATIKILASWLQQKINHKLVNSNRIKITNLFRERFINGKQLQINKISKSEYIQTFLTIEQIAQYKTGFFTFWFANIISFLSSLIILFLINKLAMLFVISSSLILLLFAIWTNSKIKNKYIKIISNELNLFEEFDLIFSNWLFRMKSQDEGNLKNKFEAILMKNIKLKTSLNDLNIFKNSIMNGFFTILQILSLFFGAVLFINKQITIGNLMLLGSTIALINSPLLNLVDIIGLYKINLANIRRLNFILNLEPYKHLDSKIDKINKVRFENVDFGYSSELILKNLSLSITDNIHIFGKNGSGKSTILKLIYGLFEASGGTIFFNEIDIQKISLKWLHEKMVFIDNNTYFKNGSILNFITMENNNSLAIFMQNYKLFELNSLFNYFGLNLSDNIEQNGDNLSSGQKQFLMLMQLFNNKYDLILLDECFENISLEILPELTKRICGYQSQAIFIEISHSNRFVCEHSNNFFVF